MTSHARNHEGVSSLEHAPRPSKLMEGIDGIRAIAVTLVVIFHIYAFGSGSPAISIAGLDLRPWLGTGFVGVDLFFVLSGFLLMLPWTNSYYTGKPVPSIREFYRRRILRIAPAYYAHLAVLFLVLVPLVHSKSIITSPSWLITLLTHLSFTQYLFPWTSASFGINGALWTLTIEACFYLILPFAARFFLGWKALVGLVVAMLIAQGWIYFSFHQLFDFIAWIYAAMGMLPPDRFTIQMFLALQFPGQAIYFATGMAITNLFFHCSASKLLNGPVGSLLTVAFLAGLLWIMWLIASVNFWHTSWRYIWQVVAAVVLGHLVLFAAAPNGVAQKILGAPSMRVIGLISYGIYLWHLPLILMVKKYFLPSDLKGVDIFYFMLLTCLPSIILIGYFSYRFIELPFLRRRERPTRYAP